MPKDPICGMDVEEKSAIRVVRDGSEYFFCSAHCMDKFIAQSEIGAHEAVCCSTAPKKSFFKNRLFIIVAVILFFLAASIFFPKLVSFRNIFLMYLSKIWWAVIVGLILGGIIDHYIPREYISKVLSKKHPSTIFNAVILGFLMSACSHGILALAIQLHKKGASNAAVVSFLLASPWANFAITIMLISFFGIKALFIILAAILVAINTGFIYMFLEKKNLIEKNKNTAEFSEDFSILKDWKKRFKDYKLNIQTLTSDFRGVLSGSVSLGDMVLWWIALGMLIASFAGAYIPVHFFHKFMAPNLIGLMVTLGLATVIEVCSEGSSPLAFEIYRQTHALGNSFVFLMGGVVTDYTEIGLLWTNVGKKAAMWLPLITVPQVVIIGFLINSFIK